MTGVVETMSRNPRFRARAVARVIAGLRVPLESEDAAQAACAKGLLDAGMAPRREVALARGERLDILVDGVAVEDKIAGGRRETLRQLERYARLPEVEALVLATSRGFAWGPDIDDTPLEIVNLGRGWL